MKDYRTTLPRHLPCGGRPVNIQWRKARWCCTEPACPRGSFTEAIRAVPVGMRTTTALRRAAGAAVCDGSRTVVQAGRDPRLSRPGRAALLREVCGRSPAGHLVDRDRRDPAGQPVRKQNPATSEWELVADAWHIGFVDAIGGRGLFGQVEGRTRRRSLTGSLPGPPPARAGPLSCSSPSATSPTSHLATVRPPGPQGRHPARAHPAGLFIFYCNLWRGEFTPGSPPPQYSRRSSHERNRRRFDTFRFPRPQAR
ncbi:hypothetical protein F3K43_28775 [Streptomyces sp. LBUM 1476]|nr:hypothetical protein [Streptomyces sp. LBUM 1476]MBZ3910674.1 hypothetical protein [Streptomyces acidiscabies]